VAHRLRDSAAIADAALAGLLYERYAGRLLAFCRSRLGSREEAEDAVQQTFLNAHRSLRSGTVPRAEATWMFAIAANVCRERRRSAWRRSRGEVVSDDGLVGEQAAPEHSHDELAGVADALAALTPNQRRAMLMREWQGLSYREIAGELTLTEGAVETLIFRARRSLARKLDRSRGSIWGISNLGSAFAWGKAVLGGTAAQVAAATLAVGAGLGGAAAVPMHGSVAGEVVSLRAAPKAASTHGTLTNRRALSPRRSRRATSRRRSLDTSFADAGAGSEHHADRARGGRADRACASGCLARRRAADPDPDGGAAAAPEGRNPPGSAAAPG
jgi:RNA polymerase sigma-70 factor (ECF subfamily)